MCVCVCVRGCLCECMYVCVGDLLCGCACVGGCACENVCFGVELKTNNGGS